MLPKLLFHALTRPSAVVSSRPLEFFFFVKARREIMYHGSGMTQQKSRLWVKWHNPLQIVKLLWVWFVIVLSGLIMVIVWDIDSG
jgi:hypothetical protein